MLIYRLASRLYPADTGEGASLYGGRWNEVGTAVIYASGSISLAALEVIVHNGAVPIDYQVVEITIPDDLDQGCRVDRSA
jgi:RES domain-containing protein